jgi:hypothetical protein
MKNYGMKKYPKSAINARDCISDETGKVEVSYQSRCGTIQIPPCQWWVQKFRSGKWEGITPQNTKKGILGLNFEFY